MHALMPSKHTQQNSHNTGSTNNDKPQSNIHEGGSVTESSSNPKKEVAEGIVPKIKKEIRHHGTFFEILAAILLVAGIYFFAARFGLIENSRFNKNYKTMHNEVVEMSDADGAEDHILHREYM